jgi:signal transduction histidine kinase
MKTSRAGPVLLVGFGLLIGLIALTGAGALKRAQDSYRDLTVLNERYRRGERALAVVGNSIYVGGLLARDYLLDPSNANAAEYRARLLAERTSMEQAFADLDLVLPEGNRSELQRLRAEEQGYWEAHEPLFTWTPQEKAAQSWSFLRREILPRRKSAMSLAHEISLLAQANLQRQREEIDARQADLAGFIRRMLAVTVLFGTLIACSAIIWITKLEKRSLDHQRRTELAERELRRLSRQLVQAQEAERKSISRELHDEVGQMLTGLRMEVSSIQQLRASPGSAFDEHVDSAKRLAEQSLRALKDIAMGLRPSMLDDLGLGSAIQWQARQFAKHTGIPVNVHIDGLSSDLPEAHRTCVYRVVQEALTNCARHSGAKSIDVDVAQRAGNLCVSVIDDGVGFNPADVWGKGMGLLGMQERVIELGGELHVKSQPHMGAALTATLPLAAVEETPDGHSYSVSR